MLEDTIALHRSGRLDEAEQAYRQLLAGNPDDAGVLHLLGILRGQRGDVAGGLQLVARAGTLEPDNAACQHTLGEMHLSERHLDEAAAAFERARVLNPNLAAAHAGLGQVALLRGDLDAAESAFKAALRADENDVQARAGLGNVALARGDSARALRWLNEAAAKGPDDPLIQASYARALLEEGTLDFAAKALDNALTVKPDYPLALVLRADVHVRKGDIAAAMPIYESLLARGEQVAKVRASLGDIALQQGRHADAIAQYDEALRQEPAMQHAAIQRAEAMLHTGQVAQALDDLHRFAASHPDNLAAQVGLARLLTHGGHLDAALAQYSLLETRWPESLDVKARHALALDRAGHTEAALAKADEAASSPRPAIAMLRARGALLAGDPAAALQRLQRVDDGKFAGKPPQLRRRHQQLLGLAFDRLEQWHEAVPAFLRGQPPARQALPNLASLDEATLAGIRGLAAGAVDASGNDPAPILLCGLPGSGVEQLAAWLAAHAGVHVRRDRFVTPPDFISAGFDPRLAQALDSTALALLARRYGKALERLDVAADATVIDWIPALDARVVPAIQRALPGTRILRVSRAPHDELLNWLAFGWQRGFALNDPVSDARWLRLAHAHLDAAASLLPSLGIDADALSSEPGTAVRRQLSSFLGVPALADDSVTAASAPSHGGLPFRFAPGHARNYRESLPEAFAALDGVASP